MLTLVEEMSLRTRRVQSMMRQMEDICQRMFKIRTRLADAPRELPGRATNGPTCARNSAT